MTPLTRAKNLAISMSSCTIEDVHYILLPWVGFVVEEFEKQKFASECDSILNGFPFVTRENSLTSSIFERVKTEI